MRVMLSEKIFSFPLTLAGLQRNKRLTSQAHGILTHVHAERKTYLIQQITVTTVNVRRAILSSMYPQICSQLSEQLILYIKNRARVLFGVVKVRGWYAY